MIYDFVYGGAYDEVTLSANRSDFSDILFRPKLLTDVSNRNQRTRVVGQELAFPVMVSPAGLIRLAHTEGELAIARAAGNTGVVFVVSTAASWSMEEIAEVATGPLWFQLQWVRELWKGPLLVKGILTPEDALKAADSGVDGIIVSNHGGRQLDGVPSAIRALPRIFDAVGNRVDLILDSGVRRGADVIKAMALGARAVMTGRSWIWGLAAAGQSGVERVQAILAQEIDQTLALLGRSSLEEIDRSVVEVPASWDSP